MYYNLHLVNLFSSVLCSISAPTRASNGTIEIAWNTSATTVEQVGCKCSSGCSSTRCTCYYKSKECRARCSCKECTNFNTLVAQTLCNNFLSSEIDTESEDNRSLPINDVQDADYDRYLIYHYCHYSIRMVEYQIWLPLD